MDERKVDTIFLLSTVEAESGVESYNMNKYDVLRISLVETRDSRDFHFLVKKLSVNAKVLIMFEHTQNPSPHGNYSENAIMVTILQFDAIGCFRWLRRNQIRRIAAGNLAREKSIS